jgi:hypothetical protein
MPERSLSRRSAHFTEQECIQAILEEESRLGRQMSQRERGAFARGFFGDEYRAELRRIAAWEVDS